MDTLWGLLSGNDNAGQEGSIFPQSTSSVWRLYYQSTSLCCPMFVVLDSALECPKTLFAQSSLSPQSCGLKLHNRRHLAILISSKNLIHQDLEKETRS
ncbi:hypothetical protein AMTRI_Chr05g65910 [Amborella trichopoda]